jgi:hypothetical protein
VCAWASGLFCEDLLQNDLIHGQIGHELFESAVLFLQLAIANLDDRQLAIAFPPDAVGGLTGARARASPRAPVPQRRLAARPSRSAPRNTCASSWLPARVGGLQASRLFQCWLVQFFGRTSHGGGDKMKSKAFYRKTRPLIIRFDN